SKNGVWPLYAPLYGGQGILLGSLNLSQDSLDGDVFWIKPPGTPGKYYLQGFNVQTAALGSLYTPPASGANPLNFETATLVLTGGNLAQTVMNQVTLGAKPQGQKQLVTATFIPS